MANLTEKDLMEGQIYYYKGSNEHILKCSKNSTMCHSFRIDITKKHFSKNSELNNYAFKELRLATHEECFWLEKAISENKYVPKPEYIESDNYQIY